MGFTKLFNCSLSAVSTQNGHKNCCALFCLRSPLQEPTMEQKAVERYVKEHLPKKIFTSSHYCRNIDFRQRRISLPAAFSLKSK
jgi:hypothetical protein